MKRAATGKALEKVRRGPILDRTERVEPFELEEDVEVGCHPIEPDQGSRLIHVGQQLTDVVVPTDLAVRFESDRRLWSFEVCRHCSAPEMKNPHPRDAGLGK